MTHGTAAGPPTRESRSLSALLRDERVIQVLVQLLFVAAVLWIGFILYQNMATPWPNRGCSWALAS